MDVADYITVSLIAILVFAYITFAWGIVRRNRGQK
jgi:hypothetical protein